MLPTNPQPPGQLQPFLRDDQPLWLRTAIVVTFLFLVVLFLFGAFVWQDYTIEDQEKAMTIAKDVLEMTVVLVGAAWTFRTYVLQRSERVAVKRELTMTILPPLDDGRTILKVFMRITNIGKVHVRLREWRLRADLLLPLVEATAQLVETRTAFVEEEATWITIAGFKDGTFTNRNFDVALEPGEADVQVGNLVLPSDVRVVQVYSYIARPDTPGLGWADWQIVNIAERKVENANPDHQSA